MTDFREGTFLAPHIRDQPQKGPSWIGLKQCIDAYLPYLIVTINYSLRENTFPEKLKRSEVIPLYKKLDPLKKENYRPIIKGLQENHLQTNKYLHGRQTIKMFDRFQKISQNLIFTCNYAWKMEQNLFFLNHYLHKKKNWT